MALLIDSRIQRRVDALDLPFNTEGTDPYGVSRIDVARFMTLLEPFYRHYFRVKSHGTHHVPATGRAMLIGNHSGGVAIDGAMVIASMFFDHDPPRLAQSMVEKFIESVPFAGMWAARTGQFTGLPEHALRLLEDDRLLVVFPEGARGTAKLFGQRYSLVDFGTGFVRLAMRTHTPIIPFGFVGGGNAVPTIFNAYGLGRALGAPYVPITPYLLPIPLPVNMSVHYGEPMVFEGTGAEDDEAIVEHVEQVKRAVSQLMADGLRTHER